MKILILSRGNNLRYIDCLSDQLTLHKVFFHASQYIINHSWLFKLIYFAEEYKFFHKTLSHQADYWKNRIFKSTDPSFPYWGRWSILQYLKRFYVPNHKAIKILSDTNPDIVLSTSLIYPPWQEDYWLALAAKLLNIPLIGFVLTWDNLTTKSLIQVMPDLIFCWNKFHKRELMEYHKVSEDRIEMVGPYTLEKWLKPQKATRRDKFCERYKLNPQRPILTYLCSSPAIAGDKEEKKVLEWASAHEDYQIIVRPHPDNPIELTNKWVPNPAAVTIGGGDAFDTYFHSEKLFCLNTSAAIEAMLIGKPVEAIDPAGTNTDSIHYRELRPFWDGENHTEEIRTWLGVQDKLPSVLIKEKIESFYYDWLKKNESGIKIKLDDRTE